MNRVAEVFQSTPSVQAFADGYLAYLGDVLAQLNRDEVAAFADALIAARERGARIFFIGNGGSAATASHFANDIGIGSRTWRKPFRALSLCDNQSVMTAIANDYSYAEVFSRQLMVQMQAGDVVVAISVSGNSPSIVEAITYANANGGITIGLSGFDGGALRQAAKIPVHVPTNKGEYGPAEDAHMILDHLVGNYLLHYCAAEEALAL